MGPGSSNSERRAALQPAAEIAASGAEKDGQLWFAFGYRDPSPGFESATDEEGI